MIPGLQTLEAWNPDTIGAMSDAELLSLANTMLSVQQTDRQMNAVRYYEPVSAVARQMHLSLAKTIGIGGGNGSGKSDAALVELVIRATGQMPLSLAADYPREKLRGPIACRVVVESLTTTLVPVILPKLMPHRWQGVDRAGGPRGHFGWIPQHCLIKGEWKASWTERTRTLQCYYRDPETGEIEGISTVQFNSYDQDPSDFASGDFHFVLHDEPPKYDIWRENRARVMRVDGTLMLAMTWPDDPSIPVDWIVDEVYEKAQPGPAHDPSIAWFNFFTTDNPNLNQTAVAERAKQMSATERATRIYGQPIRMSNRVHPLFTDADRAWCHACVDLTILTDAHVCGTCGSEDAVTFNHVQSLKADSTYPVINLLDPHPRKPHMLLWVQIDPNDDWQVIHEADIAGSPAQVAVRVAEIEGDYGWHAIRRLIDPNMGRSPSDTSRESTWQDAFEQAGLAYDLADDGEVGRQILNEYLRPDPRTGRPRLLVDVRCMKTIYQMKRYLWDDFKSTLEKDQKQRAKARHDDYPTCLKYLANAHPTFRGLRESGMGTWTRHAAGSYGPCR